MSDTSDKSNSIEDDKLNNNCISGLSRAREQQQQHQQTRYQPLNKTKPLKSILKKPLTSVNQNCVVNNKQQQQQKLATVKKPSLTTFAANQKKNTQSPLIINHLEAKCNNNNNRKSPPKTQTQIQKAPDPKLKLPKQNNAVHPSKPPQKIKIGASTGLNELSDDFLKRNCNIILKNIDNCFYGGKEKHLQRYLYDVSTNNQNLERLKNSNFLKMSSPAECDTTNNNMGPPSILNCSVASSQDFTHDNSDYQWFGSEYFG